jgi:predicted metal-dependent phosphoesterase TrpH
VIAFRGRWTPDDRAASIYQYLSFEVPPSCVGVRVALSYDRSAGVLDLGCLDPLGWRGWSGGARSVVLLGESASTPGYLDRGVPAGEWAVVLGLHRLASAGVPYEVTVTFGAVDVTAPAVPPVPPPGAARPPRRDLPSADGLHWLAGDLHAHTVHSDGGLTVPELAALGVEQGLDFLAVTDHNTVSHHAELAGVRSDIELIPGQELTTADGHANAFGDIGWIDFRRPASSWVDEVAGRGGVLSINHPIGYDCAWRHPLNAPIPYAEVWHSSWSDRRDGGALAWWQAAGLPVPVGGSDWHRPGSDARPGTPTTWIACADGDVLGGLAAGRTAISAGRDAPVLLRVGDELVAVDADGAMLVCPDGRRTPVRGSRAGFADHPEPHLLETDDRTVIAIAA